MEMSIACSATTHLRLAFCFSNSYRRFISAPFMPPH